MWMEYLPHENSISDPLVELSHTLILPGALIVHQAYHPDHLQKMWLVRLD